MQLIDLTAQQRRIRAKLDSRIRTVLDHGQYIMGPEVKTIEKLLSSYVGVEHALSCSSGTDALLLGLMAHGVGVGDAILTTPFSFIATAEVIAMLGAVPVFVDIDPATFNMGPDHLERAIEALKANDSSVYPLPNLSGRGDLKPRGIIPVDLFGLPADYEHINAVARKHGLFVIEDGAQSFGAEYGEKRSCALAQIGCTSFFPAKPLGCYGDGGMCFTDDDQLAERMKSLRVHGQGPHKYDNIKIGLNGRLDTLQAAILIEKFEIFPEEVELRQKVARRYTERFLAASSPVTPPLVPQGSLSAWAQYTVLAKNGEGRDALQSRLKDAGIPTAIYYPKPLHLQAALSYLQYKPGDFPVCEDYSRRVFSLPMHPYLSEADQDRIAEVLFTKA